MPVVIICPIHGEFMQTPNSHLRGSGCPYCYRNTQRMCGNHFINRSKLLHNNKYDYSKCKYFNMTTKVIIICKDHGEFLQLPANHLNGSGCPNCIISKGERFISEYLKNLGIVYEREKTFSDCIFRSKLKFDFYLPKLNILIEFDGYQHYYPVNKFGGEKYLEFLKNSDFIKNKWAFDNNIKLIRISFEQINDINLILDKELKFNNR